MSFLYLYHLWPQVFGTQEKDFHDFEYENFETGPKALNDDLSGHINVNFEDLGQHSEWIQSVGVPKIQKSQPLKILVINSTTNSTMEHYFDDDIVPKITLILSIIIPIVLVVTGNVNYVRIFNLIFEIFNFSACAIFGNVVQKEEKQIFKNF